MCDLEAELRHLVSQAQQYPLQSFHRRRLCDRLYRALLNSQKLARPNVPPQLRGSYTEIYNTALQHLFEYLYKNVERYNPGKGGVLPWVNFLLSIRFPDAIREVTNLSQRSGAPLRMYSLDELNQDLLTQSSQRRSDTEVTAQDVVKLLRNDPEGEFHNSHVKHHPQATFQAIALHRIEGYSWRELSSRWSIPVPTLSTFYQRQIKSLLPHFQTYLQS